LFCISRRDVTVMVSQPASYAGVAYSTGARALWHLDLGETPKLRVALRSVDTARLEALDGTPSSTAP
jgi:hypothetical protein